jgi:hypothetical protein
VSFDLRINLFNGSTLHMSWLLGAMWCLLQSYRISPSRDGLILGGKIMKRYVVSGLGSVAMTMIFAAVLVLMTTPSHAADKKGPSIDRGRYIVKVGGCNDCHTAGFTQANGQMDEQKWLTGDVLGWQGAWGTTFAINLRQFVGGMTEDQWVQVTRNSKARPPMPTWIFRDMTETDLRSVYRFVRSLGVAGDAAPAYLPSGQSTQFPLVKFPQ